MDPSSSNCANKLEEVTRDGLAEGEVSETDISSSSSSDYEDSIDGDAQESIIGNGGQAKEELGIELVRAAIDGNLKIFSSVNEKLKLSEEQLLRKSVEENNILHIAIRYKHKDFVKALLEKHLPTNKRYQVITERNSQGDTPLHVAAEVGDFHIVQLLFSQMMKKKSAEEGGHDGVEEKPWRAQNSEGNTALHVAILNDNFLVADYLLGLDGGILARMVNNSREAPLHLVSTRQYDDTPSFGRNCRTKLLLLKKARCVAGWRDAKGLTPLLRAVSLLEPSVILDFTKMIIKCCPESTLMCDPSGQSFLHLLMHNNKAFDHFPQKDSDKKLKNRKFIEDLICLKEISILINSQDQDGNTPLHIAFKSDNIHKVRSLFESKCLVKRYITNKDGSPACSGTQYRNYLEQLKEPRTMTEQESSVAIKGDIRRLYCISGGNLSLQDSEGSNFLHLFMSNVAEHPYLSSSDHDRRIFFNFIISALKTFPELVCQTSQKENTPLHILAQNKDFCKTHADQTLEGTSLLSKLLSIYAEAINRIKSSRTTTNESDNHDQLPWVMQNADGNTPLHEAIIANNKVLVLPLLRYSKESTTIVNNHKETPLHLLAAIDNGVEELTVEMVEAKALELQDKNGRIPMSRAIEVMNLNLVVTLLSNFQDISNTNGKTLWQDFCAMTDQSNNFLKKLFNNEAFRRMVLGQKSKDGNTLLHIAIQEKCFGFVQALLETRGRGSEREPLEDNPWPMNLLKISNNVGETSEDLLADLPSILKELEEFLLTDRRMKGIRSSWGIPRTQLQNYMSSMNVIAALQTTITFTAAFTVPGGLNQDIGIPILMHRIAFQIFMMSDVIAMCLSMMVLICLLWMVATNNKRLSVMIQDFALSLLLTSFVATLLTFMAGVYATINPTKPWIATTTLVLCSLVMLFLPRRVLTNLLLHFKYPKDQFVKMFSAC